MGRISLNHSGHNISLVIRKMTSKEDDLKGRRPHRKTTSQEDDLLVVKGRQLPWTTTSMEDDLNGR